MHRVNIRVSEGWRKTYPEAIVGMLAMVGVENPTEHFALTERARQLEADLRSQWSGMARADLNQIPEFEAYRRYYRRFHKTYPVEMQYESIALKGKQLHSNSALVLAMFAAEIHNRLLTAGHDLAMIEGAISINVAEGGEQYTGLGGRDLTLQPRDIYTQDEVGIISSVLFGPDDRTRITENTHRVLFCVYAPIGVRPEAVENHLKEIASNVRLVAPQASVMSEQIYTTGGH
jgi:DNA/RNA-binding domain of Phe-tRNA-synthetase-like protein